MEKYTAYTKNTGENRKFPAPRRGAAPGLYTADGGFVPWEECTGDCFDLGGTEITACRTVPENSDLVIPEGITRTGAYAFRGKKLRSVTFPGSFASVGYGAFSFSGLVSVNFGNGILRIEESAFFGTAVRNIVFPPGLKKLGRVAFGSCRDLISVCFGDTENTSFGSGPFFGCASLVSVSFCREQGEMPDGRQSQAAAGVPGGTVFSFL